MQGNRIRKGLLKRRPIASTLAFQAWFSPLAGWALSFCIAQKESKNARKYKTPPSNSVFSGHRHPC
jgi:hypothetical protein